MKKNTLLLAFFILSFLTHSQNLIVNGSNESPMFLNEIQGWTETLGTSWEQGPNGSFGLPTPTSGNFVFYAGSSVGQNSNNQLASELEQTIDISSDASQIDIGTKNYYFNGYTRSFTQFPTDQSNIFIQFYDISGALLTAFNFGPFSTTESWNQITETLLAPVNSRTIKIKLHSVRLNGSSNDGLYDDLYLGNTPLLIQTNMPQTIAAGANHSLFVCRSGNATATGSNTLGQLGIGTNTTTLTAGLVSGLTDVIAVSARDQFSLFLKKDGTVWASGYNANGQLGIGNTDNKNVPVQIPSLSGIVKIATGFYHSLFLKNDGTVWACGRNFSGELGNGNAIQQNTPVQVINVSNAVDIAAGDGHSMFLSADGTVKSCGDNQDGALGIGWTSGGVPTPTLVDITNVAAIGAGFRQSIFIKKDGTAWASGINTYGKLGFAGSDSQWIPGQVQGLTGIVSGTGGQYHTLFLKNDGTAWAVGYNAYGQLGDGTNVDKSTPVQVINLTGVNGVAASGYYHSLFSKTDGTFYVCGQNGGAYGNGLTGGSTIPVLVKDNCNTLSSDEFTINSTISVYPNPSKGIFNIQTDKEIENAVITVSDLNGRVLYQSKAEKLANKQLDLSPFQAGIYLLNITNSGLNFSQKLIKQ